MAILVNIGQKKTVKCDVIERMTRSQHENRSAYNKARSTYLADRKTHKVLAEQVSGTRVDPAIFKLTLKMFANMDIMGGVIGEHDKFFCFNPHIIAETGGMHSLKENSGARDFFNLPPLRTFLAKDGEKFFGVMMDALREFNGDRAGAFRKMFPVKKIEVAGPATWLGFFDEETKASYYIYDLDLKEGVKYFMEPELLRFPGWFIKDKPLTPGIKVTCVQAGEAPRFYYYFKDLKSFELKDEGLGFRFGKRVVKDE